MKGGDEGWRSERRIAYNLIQMDSVLMMGLLRESVFALSLSKRSETVSQY